MYQINVTTLNSVPYGSLRYLELNLRGMAVASVPAHELLSRRTWEPLNGKQKGELFFARRRDALGVSCPKLQLEYFWYESLRGLLRGASAAASIERGEELCVVPLRKMITFHTIRNSSLAPMLAEFENASSEQVRLVDCNTPTTPPGLTWL